MFTLHAAPGWASQGTPDGPFIPTRGPRAGAPTPRRSATSRRPSRPATAASSRPARRATPLPRVSLIEPWNEPNLTAFLSPQWAETRLVSVDRYRRDAQRRLRRLPRGSAPREGDRRHDGAGRRSGAEPAGAAAAVPARAALPPRQRASSRRAPARRSAKFDVLSHHPISVTSGEPSRRAAPDDAGVAEMKGIGGMLRAAERQHTVLPRQEAAATVGDGALVGDEPADHLYRAADEARRPAISPRRCGCCGRRTSPSRSSSRSGTTPTSQVPPRTGWGTGILFADGEPKPSFAAIRMPFVANRVAPKIVPLGSLARRRRAADQGRQARERARAHEPARRRGRGRQEAPDSCEELTGLSARVGGIESLGLTSSAWRHSAAEAAGPWARTGRPRSASERSGPPLIRISRRVTRRDSAEANPGRPAGRAGGASRARDRAAGRAALEDRDAATRGRVEWLSRNQPIPPGSLRVKVQRNASALSFLNNGLHQHEFITDLLARNDIDLIGSRVLDFGCGCGKKPPLVVAGGGTDDRRLRRQSRSSPTGAMPTCRSYRRAERPDAAASVRGGVVRLPLLDLDLHPFPRGPAAALDRRGQARRQAGRHRDDHGGRRGIRR